MLSLLKTKKKEIIKIYKIKFGSGGRNLKRLKISRIYVHIMENVIKKSIECLLLKFYVKIFSKTFYASNNITLFVIIEFR